MTTFGDVQGLLHVRPGRPRPHALQSTRKPWASLLSRGRSVNEVPGLLANLFSLCGHAHRLCATLALTAAQGRPVTQAPANALQAETLRDHVRQVCLAWPATLLPSSTDTRLRAEAALICCPALRAGLAGTERDARATVAWLDELLGMHATVWLAAWERHPEAWLRAWSEMTPGWLPRLLLDCRPLADVACVSAVALNVHARIDDLEQLGVRLREGSAFSMEPTWRGRCAETGTWARLHDPARAPMPTPWLRLGARLAELVRLALPDVARRSGTGWLATGALRLSSNEGLGWVEMARGLLVHHVRLDMAATGPVIDAFNVLAPTEWNFHPDGAVAQAVAALEPRATTMATNGRVAALMAAYDPCVRFEIESPSCAVEVHHA